MRFLLSVILIAIFSALAEFILPWWSVAIVAFLISLFVVQKSDKAFLMGFLGVGLCWLTAALLHDIANDHILSARMAVLFKLPNYSMFIGVTVFLGGLIGGLAAWAGALMRPKVN